MAHGSATPTTVHTPKVTSSKVWRIIIIVFLLVVGFIIAVVVYFKTHNGGISNIPAKNYVFSKEVNLLPGETKNLAILPNNLSHIACCSKIECTGEITVAEEYEGKVLRTWTELPEKDSGNAASSGCNIIVTNKTNKTIQAWYSAWK